jgi:integrase
MTDTLTIAPAPLNRELLDRAVASVLEYTDVREQTRLDYQRRIPHFIDYLLVTGFSVNILRQYKNHLVNEPCLSASTKNARFYSAKVLLRELAHLGAIPDVTQNIRGFKRGRQHKRDGLNSSEIQLIAEHLRTLPDTADTYRLRAMVALLALQGLRQCEITRLDVSDLDLLQGTTLVRGKGQDDSQLVHLHPDATAALAAHLSASQIADGPVFVSCSNHGRHQRLTTRTVRGIVKSLFRELGIPEGKTTHGFRHFYITRQIELLDGDLLEVAKYSRHRNLTMLMVYNDRLSHEATLPRYIEGFSGLLTVTPDKTES